MVNFNGLIYHGSISKPFEKGNFTINLSSADFSSLESFTFFFNSFFYFFVIDSLFFRLNSIVQSSDSLRGVFLLDFVIILIDFLVGLSFLTFLVLLFCFSSSIFYFIKQVMSGGIFKNLLFSVLVGGIPSPYLIKQLDCSFLILSIVLWMLGSFSLSFKMSEKSMTEMVRFFLGAAGNLRGVISGQTDGECFSSSMRVYLDLMQPFLREMEQLMLERGRSEGYMESLNYLCIKVNSQFTIIYCRADLINSCVDNP